MKKSTTSEKRCQPRALIQRAYRRRKSLGKIQVKADLDPQTWAEILRHSRVAFPNLEPETLSQCLETLEQLYEEGRIEIIPVTR